MGICFQNGIGCSADQKKAVECYMKADKLKYPRGIYCIKQYIYMFIYNIFLF